MTKNASSLIQQKAVRSLETFLVCRLTPLDKEPGSKS